MTIDLPPANTIRKERKSKGKRKGKAGSEQDVQSDEQGVDESGELQ